MEKNCEKCQSPFQRKTKESHKQFAGRKYCSNTCSAAVRRESVLPAAELKSKYRSRQIQGKTVLKHRWVVEQHLGRLLESWEQVHHINHDRFDNRIENLEVVTQAEHALRHSELPREKPCVMCGAAFAPHKSRRRTAKTCGPACCGALRSQINQLKAAA